MNETTTATTATTATDRQVTPIVDTDGTELGWAHRCRPTHWCLTTSNGRDLAAVAITLDEAAAILRAQLPR